MAWKPVTLRKKYFAHIFGTLTKPAHGHNMEYFIDLMAILSAVAFVVGSFCFYSPNPEVFAIGDWCFIIACLVNIAISAHVLLEQIHAHKADDEWKDSQRDEIRETVLFGLSSVMFVAGCVCFMPGLSNTVNGDFTFAGIGAWLCVIGSFSIVCAVLYNAMGFIADRSEHGIDPCVADLCVRLTRIGMFLLLFAGVFFAIGSVLYRPVFGGRCPRNSTDATCVAVKNFGTDMFLAGSVCLLIQGILTLFVGYLKHNAEEDFEDIVLTRSHDKKEQATEQSKLYGATA